MILYTFYKNLYFSVFSFFFKKPDLIALSFLKPYLLRFDSILLSFSSFIYNIIIQSSE